MYKTIYVPVDNSDFSNRAIDTALDLGQAFESKVVGCHVYAAKMHDYRFKQMEYTLPEEYLEETELERQRKIHDSLITMGLELISDSYLDPMKRKCAEREVPFEPRMIDGKHHVEILKDMREHGYDLTVIGALGIGRVRDSQIGSVCERVTRHSDRDVWVVKRLPEESEPERDTILVGLDGSPQGFGALMTAIDLARKFDKKVEVISVYDPYLHYSVFNGVVNVLTEKAAKVFRFEEQNQLHEEIIDTGLASIYQSHLDVGAQMAEQEDVDVHKTLLDGKAFQKILDHVRKIAPWLVVVGRIGVHGDPEESGLGSNAENLLRCAPCDVLFTTRQARPELDVRAEESIRWTPEAEGRLERAPALVRGIARTAIYRLAVEQGHSVITSSLIEEAMDRYMPKQASRMTERLAEAVAVERAQERPTSICKTCGVTAAEPDPAKCTVCSGTTFEVISEEVLKRIAALEGGATEESTYDGRKLSWTQEAKRALWTMKDAYRRRRTKARVEKSARTKRLSTVTLEFARRFVEEETGEPLVLSIQDAQAAPEIGHDDDLKLVARDPSKNPLFSAWRWSEGAVERLFRVPSGFMRKRTQERVEALAAERAVDAIDAGLVEDGIEAGRVMMEDMIRGLEEAKAAEGSDGNAGDVAREQTAAASETGKCPFTGAAEVKQGEGAYLNEVGLMAEMTARRNGRTDA